MRPTEKPSAVKNDNEMPLSGGSSSIENFGFFTPDSSDSAIEIDKSGFTDLVLGETSPVLYISAPPLSGKSRNLKKLKTVIDNAQIPGKEGEKFPVIYLQGSALAATSFQELREKFYTWVRDAYMQHEGLKDSLSRFKKKKYDLLKTNSSLSDYEKIRSFDFSCALHELTEGLFTHYNNKRCYLLIDDMDTCFYHALLYGYIEKAYSFIPHCFRLVLRDNKYLNQAILMGICPLKFETDYSSGIDLFYCNQPADKYTKYFSFTEHELTPFIKHLPPAKQQSLLSKIKNECAIGYQLQLTHAKTALFDARALSILRHRNSTPRLTETPLHHQLIKTLIGAMTQENRAKIELLCNNESTEVKIRTSVDFTIIDYFLNGKNNSAHAWSFMLHAWTFLLFFGHLKIEKILDNAIGISCCEMRIANEKEQQFLQQIIDALRIEEADADDLQVQGESSKSMCT